MSYLVTSFKYLIFICIINDREIDTFRYTVDSIGDMIAKNVEIEG